MGATGPGGTMIEITEVRVTLFEDPRLKGYASIALDARFVVRGIKIIAGKGGRLFVAMPSRKRKRGSGYQDIAHPITPEFRNRLEEAILAEYNCVLRVEPEGSKGEELPPPAQH